MLLPIMDLCQLPYYVHLKGLQLTEIRARDGRNVSIKELADALVLSLNVEPPFARLIVRSTLLMGSLITNTTTDDHRFDLSDVNIHGPDEHDSSLGRYDIKVGDNIHVSPVRVANFLKDTHPVEARYVDTTSLARSRIRVEAESKAVGSPPIAPFVPVAGAAEAGFILMVIGTPGPSGDPTDRPARKDKVFTWMTQERFPFELGWTRSETVLTMAGTHRPLMQKVADLRLEMLNGTFTGS
jgi:hypothetical protein